MRPADAARLVSHVYQGLALGSDYAGAIPILGLDALFGLQALDFGAHVQYGWFARRADDASQCIVVLRGTVGLCEWLEDAETLPIPCPGVGMGCVHAGFWSVYGSLEMGGQKAYKAIAELLHPGDTVTVIGHSLGAALATYLTRELVSAVSAGVTVRGVFIASPKPGDSVYAHAFDGAVNRSGAGSYTVYDYVRDRVPDLPPLGYTPLPNVVVLRPADSRVAIPDDVKANHSALSYAQLLENYA